MSRYLFEYNHSYHPPAPFIEIRIDGYQPTLGQVRRHALVDSGSDGTMIPLPILQQTGARYQETAQMRGVAGASQPVELFLVAIHIGDQIINGIHAVALPSPNEIIIGRDVLNQLTLTLDGLATTLTVETNP
jgi:predicted aspartyl protease